MEKIKQIAVSITYNQKDVTSDLTPYLKAISYTDHVKGEADDISLEFENIAGKWLNEWYPNKGDRLDVLITQDDNTLNCGTFQIDEIDLSGDKSGGDTVRIKGIATAITKALRTKKSKAHEGKTLKEIAQTVADANGLELVDNTTYTVTSKTFNDNGKSLLKAAAICRNAAKTKSLATADLATAINEVKTIFATELRLIGRDSDAQALSNAANIILPNLGVQRLSTAQENNTLNALALILEDLAQAFKTQSYTSTFSRLNQIKVERETQFRETDLAFLSKLAAQYGIVFSVKGNQLIFTALSDIEKRATTLSLDLADLIRYSFTDKATKVYKSASVKYHNPKLSELIQGEQVANNDSDSISYNQETSEDILEVHTKAETPQQAEYKAKAALHEANSNGTTGEIEIKGNIKYVAGVNFSLTSLGKLSGVWTITTSTHSANKNNNLATMLQIKKIS